MADALGLMRVVTPQTLAQEDAARAAQLTIVEDPVVDDLAGYIRRLFEKADSHRKSSGEEERLIEALRTYRGEYSPQRRAEIQAFNGSMVYARLTAVKCRGATSILRDIYSTNPDAWTLAPSPQPTLPETVMGKILQLLEAEVGVLSQAGQEVPPEVIADRTRTLIDSALKAEKRKAVNEAKKATTYLDDILTEGGFYEALVGFLIDLPIFPIACIKGPIVRMVTRTEWGKDGNATITTTPKLYWERVSPFDLYFSPGANSSRKTWTIERVRLRRVELQNMIGLPGYDEKIIRELLENPAGGRRYGTWSEGERAALERRENPLMNTNEDYMDGLEFNGYVRGKLLRDWGVPEEKVPDISKDYFATCWMVNDKIVKAQLSPSTSPVPPYYTTSFEKVPGSIYGHGLPEILNDIQEVSNATLRALVNNLSISSGPQVVINTDRIAPGTEAQNLYPWKRWYVVSDPLANQGEKPIDFFQPSSNAGELLAVYKEFNNAADEISAIPRYLTGSQRTGGAASTASGLAMLMSNSGKVMQNVAANIDNDVFRLVVSDLYDLVMMTDPGHLRGDENIVVKGVMNAMKREQDRVRQLEFLGLTANPIDAPLLGAKGRASVLKAVAEGLGLDHETVVDEEAIESQNSAPQQQPPGAAPLPAPNESRSSFSGPRKDIVSNASTV